MYVILEYITCIGLTSVAGVYCSRAALPSRSFGKQFFDGQPPFAYFRAPRACMAPCISTSRDCTTPPERRCNARANSA